MSPGARSFFSGALFFCLAALPCTTAYADDFADLSSRLTARGKKLQSLQARFVQRKRLALFKSEVTSKGRFFFARPGRLRWELLPPDASVLVVRKKRAELRIPGEKPRVMDLSTNKTLGVLIEQLLVWLGVRPVADLKRWYHTALTKKDGRSMLTLKPRSGPLKKRIKQIVLEFSGDLSLHRIRLLQQDGDSTIIEFSGYRRNARVPDKVFR